MVNLKSVDKCIGILKKKGIYNRKDKKLSIEELNQKVNRSLKE